MTRQYYYKKDSCPTTDPFSSACICWHDEGTVCLDHRAMNFLSPVFEDTRRGESFSWRNKPDYSGWQPIETAPKDGTWLLLAGNTYRTGAGALVARWYAEDWESADDGYPAYVKPTHWMPLPPPPVD